MDLSMAQVPDDLVDYDVVLQPVEDSEYLDIRLSTTQEIADPLPPSPYTSTLNLVMAERQAKKCISTGQTISDDSSQQQSPYGCQHIPTTVASSASAATTSRITNPYSTSTQQDPPSSTSQTTAFHDESGPPEIPGWVHDYIEESKGLRYLPGLPLPQTQQSCASCGGTHLRFPGKIEIGSGHVLREHAQNTGPQSSDMQSTGTQVLVLWTNGNHARQDVGGVGVVHRQGNSERRQLGIAVRGVHHPTHAQIEAVAQALSIALVLTSRSAFSAPARDARYQDRTANGMGDSEQVLARSRADDDIAERVGELNLSLPQPPKRFALAHVSRHNPITIARQPAAAKPTAKRIVVVYNHHLAALDYIGNIRYGVEEIPQHLTVNGRREREAAERVLCNAFKLVERGIEVELRWVSVGADSEDRDMAIRASRMASS